MQIGDSVRVLPPFDHSFPGVYTILETVINADDTIAHILSDGAGGFDPKYLEAAP